MSDIAKAAAEYVSKAAIYQALEMSNAYGLSQEQRKAQAVRFSQARMDLINALLAAYHAKRLSDVEERLTRLERRHL